MNERRMGNVPNGQAATATVANRMAQIPHQVHEVVDDRPIATISVAFAAGLAAGVGLVALYCQTQQAMQPPTFAQNMQSSAHSISQRIVDAVRQSLPSNMQFS
jgi:hypothetical protein